MRPLRVLLVHAASPANRTLSYQRGWPRHLAADRRFSCAFLNTQAGSVRSTLRAHRLRLTGRFDLVLLLHSVFSNSPTLSGWMLDAVRRVKAPKVFFIGNEYRQMPEKMAFAEELGVALLVSQSEDPRVHALYRARLGCRVAGLPNTGFDPDLFFPATPLAERPIDLGYRSFPSPLYLGHDEKRGIARYFQDHAERLGLKLDVSIDKEARFGEAEWAAFLNRCRGQLGTEAGGDYFEITDDTRRRYNAWAREHPDHGLDEVRARFFTDYPNPVPIRIISGRNVEAAATKTVQVLFRGGYGGYLEPDVHYIPLDKDFSNVDEAVAKLRDAALCERLTRHAYELAMERFTYPRLLDRLVELLAPLAR